MPSIYSRLLTCLLLCASLCSHGQNVPDLSQTAPAGSADTITLPPAITVTGGKLNYMRSYVPRVPYTDASQLDKNTPATEATTATVYRDGFNRDIESVQHHYGTGQGSLVLPADGRFRRSEEAYLPYYSDSAYGFRDNAFREQKSYYLDLYPGESGVSYNRGINSNDTGKRSNTSYAPGKSQGGQGRGITLTHIANDAYTGTTLPTTIRIWDVNSSGNPESSSWYPANQLFGELSRQDSGSTTYTFTDKEGRLVCKTVYLENNGSPVYGTTYYVYDSLGKLRFILPPKAVSNAGSGAPTTGVVYSLSFEYRYDDKGRLAAQRRPGEDGYTELVYDYQDRPVMRRTPEEAANSLWEVTYYDVLGRITATSLYGNNDNRATWQSLMDSGTGSNDPADLSYYLLNTGGQGQAPAGTAISGNTMMSYHYYDDYSQEDPSRFSNMESFMAFSEQQGTAGAETIERSLRTRGMPTGSRIRILPGPGADTALTGDWRESSLYYDDKGRVVYTLSEDYYHDSMIHYDYAGTQYNFAGQALITKHKMGNMNAIGVPDHSELLLNEYEANTGRLLRTSHKTNVAPWKLLASYTYDELGRVGRTNLGNGAEIRDQDYNIRGQLTGINSYYAETGDKQGRGRTFGESLKYDYGFSDVRYDGKIAGMVWRGAGNNARANAYGYDYDVSGRLKKADYRKLEPPGPGYLTNAWRKDLSDYSVSNLTYDVNGNLLTMDQKGVKPGTGIVDMDRLYYTYDAGGINNCLLKVVDSAAFQDLGDFNNTNGDNIDYFYDKNGNPHTDANKGILNIRYTFFNKPSSVVLDNGGSFVYSYDAGGSKVQEMIITASDTQRTDYIGSTVYRNDTLQYVNTATGRTLINPFMPDTVSEEFYIKDHLGNVRSRINLITYEVNQYLATYEIASANLEGLMFGQMDEIRDNKPGSVDSADAKSGNLNGADSSRRIGTTLLVKVMAGDKVSMNVNNYYEGYDPNNDSPLRPEDMLSTLLGTMTGGSGGYVGGESHDTKLAGALFSGDNYSLFDDLVQTTADANKPKAYLNYLFFNESMELVSSMSGAFQADGNGSWSQIGTSEAMEMPENGYLAVYLSNSSRNTICMTCANVYFDQLSVQINKGNLLEENHYYPFGLPMAAMSGTATGASENRRKYQGNEYIQDLGLNWMDFNARQYDPQLGRFLGVDPLASSGGQEMYSPYAAMGNAPESQIDPNGEEPLKYKGSGMDNQSAFLPFAPGSFAWLDMGGVNLDAANLDFIGFQLQQQQSQQEQDKKDANKTTGGTNTSTTQGVGATSGNNIGAGTVMLPTAIVKEKGFWGKLWGGIKEGTGSAWKWIKGYHFHFELNLKVTGGKQLGAEVELGGGALGLQGGKGVTELLSGGININGENDGAVEGYYYGKGGVYKHSSGVEIGAGSEKLGVEDTWNTGNAPVDDKITVTEGYGLFTNEIVLPKSKDAQLNHSLLFDIGASVKVILGIDVKARIGVTHDH